MRLDKVHVLLCWVLLTRLGAEGRGYHVSTERRSWDDARRHCQDCYTDLVIGTPEEIKQGSHPLSESSVYWIGLRKELSSSRNGTMNSSSVPWTHWANRDPLTFQKWFPGWPVPNDTEDSCVAMLNFEFWVEENCSEPLPSICYDDGFCCEISVTDIFSTHATVTWPPASGSVGHYEVLLNSQRVLNTTDLTWDLVSLTPGTKYTVRVAALKCSGLLYLPSVTFDTPPDRISNLMVTAGHNHLNASWNPPARGRYSSFTVLYLTRRTIQQFVGLNDTKKTLVGLESDTRYIVLVLAVSEYGKHSGLHTIIYTLRSPPSNARATATDKDRITFEWTPPEDVTWETYSVKISSASWGHSWSAIVSNKTRHTFYDLKPDSKYDFEVYAIGNGRNSSSTHCYAHTVPLPPSDARATAADEDRITFEWTAPENFTRATYGVNISSASWGHSWSATVSNTTRHTFYDLKPDSKYNFEVHAMGFGGNSSSTNCSAYTVPLPPTDARATAADKDRITFEWTAPENFTGATYIVNISSGFWDYRWSAAVSNRTNHTFYDLKSGSKYNFSVHAMGIGGNSSSANCSDYTVTVEREISLSMLCSSATPLLCDQSSTREDVFNRLKAHIEKILGDNVKWSLEKKMINSTGG
ncbi:fibronectin-like isoform X1 [Salarias fasciatus]|uniref:fibronectin-like isoform X1 n=1 Tax=Salarias fasciatus TaxID=181472 RepID=UPI001176B70A|nr:fibronectin-like isoform X1 [Salarias fasciatus]XP_029943215.1 fibronectin-like isoform X1 [Salarias fasciatus]